MPATTLLQQLFAHLRRQPFDLRLEVVLADLLAHGYEFDDFLVQPVSLFARRYRRDLGTTHLTQAERWQPTRLALEVHREGLYDALPQQLFHQPSSPTPRTGVRAMIEESQIQRRKEKATRQFFLPFEQEFYRHRVLLEQEERRYLTGFGEQWYNELLAGFWQLADQLPPRPLTRMLYLLPLVHRIVGNLPLTQACFEGVLETPVRLRTVAPLRHAVVTEEDSTTAPAGVALGRVELGRDFVLGGLYHETLPALEITLTGLPPAALGLYFGNSWQARALQLLRDYFVAFETDVVIHYEVAEADQQFVLSDGTDAAVLGYTTSNL